MVEADRKLLLTLRKLLDEIEKDSSMSFDLLARACKEVLESNSDAEGWQITGVERLDEPVIGE